MNIKARLKALFDKGIKDLSDEEKAFIVEQKELLDDEQAKAFKSILDGDEDDEKLDETGLEKVMGAMIDEKLEKMASAMAEKFAKRLTDSRGKGIDIKAGANVEDDEDSTRKWFAAVMAGDKAKAAELSQKAWDAAKTSADKKIRGFAKALTTSTVDDAKAGSLIPPELYAEVFRIKETQYGLARREMFYLPFTGPGNSRTVPNLASGVSVVWTDETERKSSTQPSFSLVTQTLKKLAAIVPMSEEILEDSAVNIVGLLGELFAEATAKEEDIQFFMGTGSPWTGILNNGEVTQVEQASGSVDQLTADDLLDMQTATPSGALDGAKYFMHRSVLAIVQKLKGSDGQYIWQRPAEGRPGTIWNYPYETSDAFPAAADVETDDPYVLFGNLKKAAIFGDKQQLRVKMLDQATVSDSDGETVLNLAEQDMVALRIVQRVGYVLVLPAAVTVLVAQEPVS